MHEENGASLGRILPSDARVKGAPIRSVGHLIAGLRNDVQERLGADVPSRDLLNAWWDAVEETEWREIVENTQWLDALTQSLRRFLLWHGCGGHGLSRPPMVRRLERERAKHPLDGPSLAFKRYHLMRPDLYIRFKQAAEEKLAQGCTSYSAERIMRDMRAAGASHSGVNFAADYSRKLMAEDERFANFFRLGHRRPKTGDSTSA